MNQILPMGHIVFFNLSYRNFWFGILTNDFDFYIKQWIPIVFLRLHLGVGVDKVFLKLTEVWVD